MFSLFLELFKISYENFELDQYFLTNYSDSCPPRSYFESYEFFKMSLNCLTVPLILFGSYGIFVILMATPIELKSAKWVVFKFQVASFWFGSIACFLERPFIHYPSSARYDSGLFVLLGIPFRIASILGQTSYSIQDISRVLLFEHRFHQTSTNSMKLKTRILFYILHYFLFLSIFIFYYNYFPIDEFLAKLAILEFLPCPESTFFDENTHILTGNSWKIYTFQSVYFFALAYIFAFLSARNLWSRQFDISENRRKIQKRFLIILVFQSGIPLLILLIPSLISWAKIFEFREK
ncbi:Protein CBG17928 [Caenorhabditis briggsae]|uniref:Protein CBG17928 n=1 Tax=Caenorhabditis briggsae TaxID=6238 RepID=A8XS45_CAEBR|nr:Protein CBG17928 [Caenorhabditis briggsae]CAP35464.2 Protein CBG17928 [Caenorhabditis briggsae]